MPCFAQAHFPADVGEGQSKGMTLLKSLSAGVIISVGFVHVLPDAEEMLSKITAYPLSYVIAMAGSFMVYT